MNSYKLFHKYKLNNSSEVKIYKGRRQYNSLDYFGQVYHNKKKIDFLCFPYFSISSNKKTVIETIKHYLAVKIDSYASEENYAKLTDAYKDQIQKYEIARKILK